MPTECWKNEQLLLNINICTPFNQVLFRSQAIPKAARAGPGERREPERRSMCCAAPAQSIACSFLREQFPAGVQGVEEAGYAHVSARVDQGADDLLRGVPDLERAADVAPDLHLGPAHRG